ncbi:MAG TPA: pitrilysin family protein [Candidatus Acidoferrales bacterium]|nr:pitrilysin family protein [Candidatus Acidoferrales bacterium]
MKLPAAILLLASAAGAQNVVTLPGPPAPAPPPLKTVALPSRSPLVTFRIVFTTGAALDPADKPGLARLTAQMVGDAGTRDMTYQQIVDALFPMAAGVGVQVDKEMTTFSGATHADNLDAYYKLLRAMLLEPGWRDDDFRRVKDAAINAIKVSLRGNNDEELGKEVLYETLYQGSPYGRYNGGTVSSIEKLTLDDVKAFYRSQYTQANLVLGIAGGYSAEFLEAMKRDFRALPVGTPSRLVVKSAAQLAKTHVVIVDKDTRSVAFSIGYPIDVLRGSKDYAALLLVSSYLGQHRMSGGVLYQTMRESRGLNYGDYAYIEYFPEGMYLMEPQPNLARHTQIFQVWVRPVEPPTAKFALRLALFELDKLRRKGMTQAEFESSRGFLTKYVNVLTRTKRAELGYAIDSDFYGIPQYNDYLKTELAKLTLAEVNRVIQRYIHADRAVIAVVTRGGEDFKRQLLNAEASPMKYNSPKPAQLTEEDKIVEKWPLNLRAEDITVKPVTEVFQ